MEASSSGLLLAFTEHNSKSSTTVKTQCVCVWVGETHKLEAAADRRLDVGAAEGGDFAQLPGDLDGVVEEEAQATLVTETRGTGNLSEQNWGNWGGRGSVSSVKIRFEFYYKKKTHVCLYSIQHQDESHNERLIYGKTSSQLTFNTADQLKLVIN